VNIQRLERSARDQLKRVYDETRRVGSSTLVPVERRAVDRVHKLIALTRNADRPGHRRASSR
jgi:hypothetical protein